MEPAELNIDYLPLEYLKEPLILKENIYEDMFKNYYWSDDFSVEYYIRQAKAGFIAITEDFEGRELLIPEIQFNYALLDFHHLHISRKVKKLLANHTLKLEVSEELTEVYEGINSEHQQSWLTPNYLATLKATQNIDENFRVISVAIRQNGQVVAGELGYMIGRTYTSLSGFTRREKLYRNYGTAQLVLLAHYLEEKEFAFWNLGHPYMDYKLALGAKIYERPKFLKRWHQAINQ
jgi:Leu/Phe-tRNA-protein transferase